MRSAAVPVILSIKSGTIIFYFFMSIFYDYTIFKITQNVIILVRLAIYKANLGL